jgi:hypothetical protein
MELCYTLSMNDENQHIWHSWAKALHRWGIGGGTAVLLEVAGPLTLLAAQAVYLGQPLLNGWLPGSKMTALAGMLDDPKNTQVFIQYLREAPNSEPGA